MYVNAKPARTSCAPPVTPPQPSPTGRGAYRRFFAASAQKALYAIYIRLSAPCVCKCESARTSCAPPVTPPCPSPTGGGAYRRFFATSAREAPYVIYIHLSARCVCKCEACENFVRAASNPTPTLPHRGRGHIGGFCRFSARSAVCHLHTLERPMCM